MATIIIFRRSHAQKIKMESLYGQKEKVKKFLALSMCNTYVLPSRHQLHGQIQRMLGTCALYIYIYIYIIQQLEDEIFKP